MESICKTVDNIMDTIKIRMNTGKSIQGMRTGLIDFDYMIDGLHRGEITMIGSRFDVDSTMLALNIVDYVTIKNGQTALYLSLKESKEVLVYRLLAIESQIKSSKIQDGKLDGGEWKSLKDLSWLMKEAPLFIDDMVKDMANAVETFCNEGNEIDIVIVDDIQQFANIQHDALDELERLKGLAMKHQFVVVLLSQLKNLLDFQNVHRVSSRNDFCNLATDAPIDNMVVLNRVVGCNKREKDMQDLDVPYNGSIIVREQLEIKALKNKHKEVGICLVNYYPENGLIRNLDK